MHPDPLRILVAERDPPSRRRLSDWRREGPRVRVRDGGRPLPVLALIQGLQALHRVGERWRFIVWSGMADEEQGMAAPRHGADAVLARSREHGLGQGVIRHLPGILSMPVEVEAARP